MTQASSSNDDPKNIEELAAAEHASWSSWTKWMLEEIEKDLNQRAKDDGRPFFYDAALAVLSTPCVQRWRRQMTTSYSDLPEAEKESDRIEARKKLAAYEKAFER
jgi:hypothetical protein